MTIFALRELLTYFPDLGECELGSAFDRRKLALSIATLQGLSF